MIYNLVGRCLCKFKKTVMYFNNHSFKKTNKRKKKPRTFSVLEFPHSLLPRNLKQNNTSLVFSANLGQFVNEMFNMYPLEFGRSTATALSFCRLFFQKLFKGAFWLWGLNQGSLSYISPALFKFYVETGSY